MNSGTPVKLDTKTWISLIVVVATATAGTYGLVIFQNAETNRRMDEVDQKWQVRTDGLTKELRMDLKELTTNVNTLALSVAKLDSKDLQGMIQAAIRNAPYPWPQDKPDILMRLRSLEEKTIRLELMLKKES